MNNVQKYTLMVSVTTAFLTTYMGSSLNLSIPGIESHFGVSTATVGWVVTAYMLAVSAFNVPMGKVADAKGRKRVLMVGLVIFALSSAAAPFSPGIEMLIVMRMVQGIGAAMLFATNNAVLLSVFPVERHGSALGMSVASTYTGLTLGPVIGGVLNKHFGWQSVFLVAVGIGAVALVLAAKGLPDKEKLNEEKGKDVAGNLVYMAMIICLIFGFTDLSVKPYAWAVLLAGFLLGVMFVRIERKAKAPVMRLGMFKDKIFLFSNIAAYLNYGATYAISYLLSIYLQVIKGYDSQTAGLLLIVQPAVMALLSTRTGKLADRIQPYKLASFGMALCVLGLFLLTFLKEGTSLAYIVVLQVFLGIGFAFFSSPNTKAIMDRVPAEEYGVANSIVATMRNLGHAASMAIVTIVVGIMMGSASLGETDPAHLIKVTHVVFMINVGLCLAGTFLSMWRREE